MAEDGTTPPSGEDLLDSIRRLVTLRETQALVLTGAQRVADGTDAEDAPPEWLARINTATAVERDADDPFAHRAPAARDDSQDDTWPALSKESLGLVRAGMDYTGDDFEEDDEPVWSGSIMRRAKPEPTPAAPEPFLLTEPAQEAAPTEAQQSEAADDPLPLTDRIDTTDTTWDDVDQLAARLSAAPEAEPTASKHSPASDPLPQDADIAAQIEAAVARDIGGATAAPSPEDGDAATTIVDARPDDATQIAPKADALTASDDTLPPALASEDLNALVSAIVREELRGELGVRITRNVRKLVRREIYRAIANGELSKE